MSITRDQVADLHRGDVVEYGNAAAGWAITGALWEDSDGTLRVGSYSVRYADGSTTSLLSRTLTVVSRAPRPLYVNHPRAKAVSGDVARDEDIQETTDSFVYLTHVRCHLPGWFGQYGKPVRSEHVPARLRLLVDGETGTAVTS